MLLKDNFTLRLMRLADAPTVLEWENNPENWEVSNNDSEYSLEDIEQLAIASTNIVSTNQQRFIIDLDGDPLGAVDLFLIDFEEKVAGVGILIAKYENRKKGYALKALLLVEEVAKRLGIDILECSIHKENSASIRLFEKLNYKRVELSELKIDHGADRNRDLFYYQKCLKN